MTPRSAILSTRSLRISVRGAVDNLEISTTVTRAVFDPSIRWKTDQFIYRFRMLGMPSGIFRLKVTNATYQNFWTVRSHGTC
jgi:hypothetical protein